jgi:hypothetical protein
MLSVISPRTATCTVLRSGTLHLLSALVLIVILPLPAHPEPRQINQDPDSEDLRIYLQCAQASNERLLGFDEAAFCSTAFTRIKLSFLPDMRLDTYNRLPPLEKSAVDRLGYARYLEWKRRNAAKIDALIAEIQALDMES